MLSNRWSTMPTHGAIDPRVALPLPDGRAFLDRMPGSETPVIHQRWEAGDNVPFWARYWPRAATMSMTWRPTRARTRIWPAPSPRAQLAEQASGASADRNLERYREDAVRKVGVSDLTYCLGILLAAGLVLASDSRSNAGVDQVQKGVPSCRW